MAAGLCALVAVLVLGSVVSARAQPGISITIAPTLTIEAPGQSLLAISVSPPDKIPRNSFLRLRGLPPMAALSDGHSIAPGAWAVSLSSLPGLKLTVPASASGRSEIQVILVSVEGVTLAEARTLLVIAPLGPGASTATTILRAAPGPGYVPAPPKMTPADRERALRLLKRGQDALADANIAEARLFFERAADAGLADAALALGATFDAAELQRLSIRGAQPDAKEARRWYERAAQLGAADASARLQRLGKQ